VTEPHDDDDLMVDTDEPTQILGTSSIRTAARSVATEASAKEASPNGSSAAAEKDPAVDDVPALPADSIGATRDSFSFGRSAPAPVSPATGEGWTSGDHGMYSPAAAVPVPPEDEPAPVETGTGWPADSTLFGTGAGLGPSAGDSSPADPAPAQPSSNPEAATVSAAAFVWDPPEPAATSPSSPARNFLRSSTNAASAAPPWTPAVSVGPVKDQAGPVAASAAAAASAPGARPKRSARRSARQAHLTIARVEPWSVMKFSFVVSLVAFVILFVAVSVIYGTLSTLGVFTSLQHVVQSVTSSQDSSGVNAAKWFTASRILSYTALLGALNIVLITAMCTIGAVVYNLTSRLIGGVEVTLRETE
jgi:hypothetical protein